MSRDEEEHRAWSPVQALAVDGERNLALGDRIVGARRGHAGIIAWLVIIGHQHSPQNVTSGLERLARVRIRAWASGISLSTIESGSRRRWVRPKVSAPDEAGSPQLSG